jgi:hypothetical protein
MRYTIIDADGTVSFVGPCEALPALVAACADDARSLRHLLASTRSVAPDLAEQVACGVAVFDEHNVPGAYGVIHEAIANLRSHEMPVFRVDDDQTRQASLQPAKAGVIILNLANRRIVPIQNTYAEIRNMGARARRLERAGWRIVP